MDVDNEDSIKIIKKESSKDPNTYKIVCDTDENPPDEILPDDNPNNTVYEIYEYQDDEIVTPKQTQSDTTLDETTLKENIVQLLSSVVEEDLLIKFGYPYEPIEKVLCSVIEECGQSPIDDASDTITKLRENVKLLFTSVIGDDSIKEMLNNHSIDEVICHVIKLSDK